MQLYARITAAAAALATALLGAAPAAPLPAQSEPAGIVAGPAEAQISPGDDLEISVGAAGATIDGATIEISVTNTTVDTRYALSAWLEGHQVYSIRPVTTVELEPGAAAAATVEVSADDLGFDEQTPAGAYGLRIDVDGSVTQTLLTVGDSYASAPTVLSLAAILRSPLASAGLLDSAALVAQTSNIGALTRQLDSVEPYPISVGIDPMIETSAAALSGPVPATASAWIDRAHDLPHPFHTSYAMSDVLAQLSAGTEPLRPLGYPLASSETGYAEGLPTVLAGHEVIDATDRAMSVELLQQAADLGTPVITTEQLQGSLTTPTPSAHTTVGGVSVLAADAEVQRLLDTASRGSSQAARHAATSSLLGLLATISREAPNSPRHLAATIDPSGPGAADLLAALGDSGWIELAPMETALEAAPSEATLQDAEPSEFSEAMEAAVSTVRDNDRRISEYSEISADPLALHVPLRLAALAALRSDGLEDDAALTRQLTDFSRATSEMLDAVRIVPGSEIHIVGSSVQLPVEVMNDLDSDAAVIVQLRTMTPIVIVERAETEVTIASGSSQRVLIPVEVVGSGTTQALVTLQTPSGVTISQPVSLRVQAQPMIETVLLWLGIAAVALLMGFGLWRSVRKRRRGTAAGDLDIAQAARHSTKESQRQ